MGGLPVEVQLAWEVMTCKAMRETYDRATQSCRYFNRHFGPYPAYDWISDQSTLQVLGAGATRQLPAKTNGMRFSVPALVGGCRKAPLMTIGINPNMPSWQLTPEGGAWCYPYFDDIAEYATYYRHQTIYQERFTPTLIKNAIDVSTALIATKPGSLVDVGYSADESKVVMTLQYEGEESTTVSELPRGAVVTLNKKRSFAAGTVLAGTINLPVGMETTVTQETVGYYQRFATILELAVKTLVDAGELGEGTDLHAGEDVLLGDMVACASPGWTAQSGGVPEKDRVGIADECCVNRGWLAQQYLHTAPALVVFSGTSALNMFRQSFNGIAFMPQLPADLKGPYAWLRFTLRNKVMMTVKGGRNASRVVISPHFSYAVNFSPVYAFTLEGWQMFETRWPDQAKALGGKPNAGQVLISPDNPNASEAKMGAAWPDFRAQFLSPYVDIANVIVAEIRSGRLVVDGQTKHFVRTPGACHFCANQLFELPKGCPYGKLDEPVDDQRNELLKLVSRKMITG